MEVRHEPAMDNISTGDRRHQRHPSPSKHSKASPVPIDTNSFIQRSYELAAIISVLGCFLIAIKRIHNLLLRLHNQPEVVEENTEGEASPGTKLDVDGGQRVFDRRLQLVFLIDFSTGLQQGFV
ncbi:hypothetical protein L6452_31964 [Arctium lappa]|uniref:Uncharacterized protein n=1 Tax=Arctium lappa TaxID=4217 RepID=A0ACB8Z7H3_ARCLA|nr:hypothetical protein L6452_31964 [Arctium lappa]